LALLALPLGARAARSLTLKESLTLALEQNASLLSLQSEVAAAQARLDGASLFLQTNPQVAGTAGPRV